MKKPYWNERFDKIYEVLIRMEERLNIIETMIYVDDVAKKQILKGNE